MSPTTNDVVTASVIKPGADTTILYGPPGLKPPAKYFPDESVVFVTTVFVGSKVIFTSAPDITPDSLETEPVISDVNSWDKRIGEKNNENNDNLIKFLNILRIPQLLKFNMGNIYQN